MNPVAENLCAWRLCVIDPTSLRHPRPTRARRKAGRSIILWLVQVGTTELRCRGLDTTEAGSEVPRLHCHQHTRGGQVVNGTGEKFLDGRWPRRAARKNQPAERRVLQSGTPVSTGTSPSRLGSDPTPPGPVEPGPWSPGAGNLKPITRPQWGKWTGPGLNRRHLDFQSSALPAELPVQTARTNKLNMPRLNRQPGSQKASLLRLSATRVRPKAHSVGR